MLTHENFEQSLNELLSIKDKNRVIKSNKEFCIITLHTFNVGSIMTIRLTNTYKECEHPNYIVYTNDIQYKINL